MSDANLPTGFDPRVCEMRHNRIESSLDRLNRTMFGNGVEGMVTSVALIKQRQEEQTSTMGDVKKKVEAMDKKLATFAGGLAAIQVLVSFGPKLIELLK